MYVTSNAEHYDLPWDFFKGLPHVQTNWFITTQVVFGDFSAAELGKTGDILLPTIQHLDAWWRPLWKWGDVPRQKKTDDEAMDLEYPLVN